MTRSLIALPFRLGVRATRLVLRPYVAATKLALDLVRGAAEEAAPPQPPPPQPGVVVTPPPEPAPAPAPAPAVEPEPIEPVHVSEEPELVAESADAEAADGAGAEIEVDEPWEGYRRLKADEILAAVPDLTREELAVVDLYETTHRSRRVVLAAVERRLKELSGPAARNEHRQ